MKKTIVITGTSRGLGKAFVDVLMNYEDCFVISLSRQLSEDQKQYSSERFHFIKVDLSDDKLIQKIEVLKDLITNEAVYFINNASIIEPLTKVGNIDDLSIDNTLSVNIKSTMLITKFLLSNFNSNALTFANISSGAAKRAIRNWSLYCSSKAFTEMFFDVAAEEYKAHRFLNINPGVMDTGMQKTLRASDFPDVENFKALQTEGQLKQPIDVANDLIKNIIFTE
ncbi:SDR family NAD(P)-dependent oxidoreductase [Winogradskyella sp. PG-2]|uniref:SDR family NAD(P)-dependent oxidoreductase n=1 Tax=Winogradskyella sp. PG-2 TaxID=754409 RepID=UPI0004586415|nr:SDR family NAD(P)-dependent oxidoreductase [Winogradskyella sp. PG-2]BAO75055.1 benzil reductase [Winogradskyella sp. PG-2]